MTTPSKICFVCENPVESLNINYHTKVNLPVYSTCCGSEKEIAKVEYLLEGLAEGFVCGCI
jgi:hypothetical protein